MGKETDLIKAVKNNDKSKLQKLFLPEGDYKVCKSATAGGGIRMKLRHINVDCQEPSTGYTPLILAILHGHKDVADSLIFYAADVNATDSKGNTPLHMAVFSDRADMADVLLRNKAQVNLQNSDGNTPLHIACQNHASSNVLLLLKLLQAGSDLSLENKAGLSPLELASMFNMKATVSAILDHSPGFLQSEKNTKCITEAAIRGHSQIVETLLDYGCDPNVVHPSKQTRPLPEAVRFFRTGVVKILLEFGAKPDLLSADMMNAVMVAKTLPAGKSTEFLELFKEFAGKPPRVPKYLSEEGNGLRDVPAYPLLPQQPEWTKNTPDFCNSCMAANPNTSLLDGNERSFWVVPSVQGAWTVFDMGHPHTITGLRIWGWDSLQMVKMLEMQKGASLKGPWSTVSLLRCRREGSTSPNDPGVAQDFRSFVDTSRFWRLLIVDNHGGKCSCFQGVQFYGADDRIAQVLQKHDLQTAVDSVIVKGSNTFEGFVMMSQKELSDILPDCSEIGGLMTELSHLRLLVYPLTKLSWLQAPVTIATEGKSIPEFSVQSDPRVTEEIELVTEGSEAKGQTKVTLQAAGPKEPSIATFSGVVFSSVGSVVVSARSIRFPHISVTPAHCLEVRCAARDKEDIAAAFEDIEAMLEEARISLETPQEEFSVAEINWS